MNDIAATDTTELSPIDLLPDLEYKGEDALGMTVFVVEIAHRFGTEASVCASEARAHDALARYVREWWDEVESEAGPIDALTDKEAVDRYFGAQLNLTGQPEVYAIHCVEVE